MSKVLGNLDLNKNELQNAILHPLSSAPTAPKEGQIYYNTIDKKTWQYNGTAWVDNVQTFQAIYGITTFNEIETALQNGKIVFLERSSNIYFCTVHGTGSSLDHYFTCIDGSTVSTILCSSSDVWYFKNIGELQSAITTDTITTTTTWSGSGPYTQVVTPASYSTTAYSKVDIQPNAAVLSQLMTDGVTALYIENNNRTLTMYALGAAPTTAMTLQVTIMEVTSA